MQCPVISTPNGKVKGSVKQAKCKDAKPVYAYRNIPFAKPPVGSLRFMPPQPAEPWTGVRDGTVVGTFPMQTRQYESYMAKIIPIKIPVDDIKLLVTDEDCLHLSIYTPEPSKGKKLPVMVWLYGGGFSMGSETSYDGTALAGMNDVVVVVPNYRVSIFGFLSLGKSSVCPGNVGLLDQQLALKWVRDNIGHFGGDSGNVTIFGESAGGVSVNHHIISPMSRGLFHKAISQSGQSTMSGLLLSEKTARKHLNKFLEHLKVDEKDDVKILEALQKIPADDLVKATDELAKDKVSFIPVVDGEVISKEPEQYIKDGDFAKVPYIMGCNNTEGYGLLATMAGPDFNKGLTEEQAKNSIFLQKNDQLFDAWKKFYIKDENDDARFSKLFGSITADTMFVVPAVSFAAAHSEKADTYFYQGAFQVRFSHDKDNGKELMKKMDWCYCDHGDDVHMVWGFPFTPGDLPEGAWFTDEEAALSRKIMTYFTNFAKNGDPNKGTKVDCEWPKHKKGGPYIIFDHKITIGTDLAPERVEFWSKTFPELKEKYPVEE